MIFDLDNGVLPRMTPPVIPAKPIAAIKMKTPSIDRLAQYGGVCDDAYPLGAIREGDSFYDRNFRPECWPCGNPEREIKDTHVSPSKSFVATRGEPGPFCQHAFSRPPAERLVDLSGDPDRVTNLVNNPACAVPAEPRATRSRPNSGGSKISLRFARATC